MSLKMRPIKFSETLRYKQIIQKTRPCVAKEEKKSYSGFCNGSGPQSENQRKYKQILGSFQRIEKAIEYKISDNDT